MRQTRSKTKLGNQDDTIADAPSTSEPQLCSHEEANTSTSVDENQSTSSSESESDLDSDDGASNNIAPDDPVRHKLPFNRETGNFDQVQVSPGSLENGKDVRDLGKLQEMLLTNP